MSSVIWEVTFMSAFVLFLGSVLHFYAYKHGLGDTNGEVKTPSKSDQVACALHKTATTNPLIKKWLNFGGGYYGIVAFAKLILIELAQLKGLIVNLDSTTSISDLLSINTIVHFIIEQIQNFVAAIIWPTDYLRMFSIGECAVFVVVTYAFYEGSKQIARQRLKDKLADSAQ